MGSIGLPEMVFIFVLALLIFGPKKLPELGRSLGKGLSEFRRASTELRSSLEREMDNIEREAKAEEEAKKTAASTTDAKTEPPADKISSDPYESDNGSYDYAGYSGDRKD